METRVYPSIPMSSPTVSPPVPESPDSATTSPDLAAATNPSPVPAALRIWFRVHCALDLIFAIPLLLVPARLLGWLGWASVDPVSSRLCGAALLAIGSASLMVDRHGLAGYRALLGLKVVWSLAAVFAILAGIANGAPPAAWALLSIFIVFAGVWSSFAIRLRQLSRADRLDDDQKDNARADQDDTDQDDADQDDADPPVS
jgi:hypothetical protein